MKKVILLILAGMLMISPAFAEDDDSTPYMPYPETPQPEQRKLVPAKKTPTKKKTPAKNATAKKNAPAKKSAPKSAPRASSLQQGIALMQQDKYEQAKPYLLKAIQEDRNDPNAWYWYGVYHEKTGGFYQAQYFYSKAVTIDPAFEPLSRVVYYPDDADKTPLWDPKRPARVYRVDVADSGGITGLPGRSSFPDAPNDPEIPNVPVYLPPDPGSNPLQDGSWNPAVYVPPRPEELGTEGEITPVYLPPEPQSIVANNSTPGRQVIEIPVYSAPESADTPTAQRDIIIRADKPLYTPPQPEERVSVPTKQTAQKPQVVKTPPTKTTAKTPKVASQRTASVPTNRVVRQPQKKKQVTPKQPQRQAASRDVRPQTPPQTTRQQQPTPRVPEQITPPPEPETVRQNRQQNQQYFPPVGQQAPDPGTVPEVQDIPPVGQGNQY